MLIAFQGEPGAYSEAAALTYSPQATTLPCPSFDEVFAAVDTSKSTHAASVANNGTWRRPMGSSRL